MCFRELQVASCSVVWLKAANIAEFAGW